jgi:hypothetical protein
LLGRPLAPRPAADIAAEINMVNAQLPTTYGTTVLADAAHDYVTKTVTYTYGVTAPAKMTDEAKQTIRKEACKHMLTGQYSALEQVRYVYKNGMDLTFTAHDCYS